MITNEITGAGRDNYYLTGQQVRRAKSGKLFYVTASFDGYIRLFISVDNGITWSYEDIVDKSSTYDITFREDATIAIDPDNEYVYIVVTQWDNGGTTDVILKLITNETGSWVEHDLNTFVDDSPKWDYPHLEWATDGELHLFLYGKELVGDANSDFWYARRDVSKVWQAWEQVYTDVNITAIGTFSLGLVIDKNDTLYFWVTGAYALDVNNTYWQGLMRTRTSAGVWTGIESTDEPLGSAGYGYMTYDPVNDLIYLCDMDDSWNKVFFFQYEIGVGWDASATTELWSDAVLYAEGGCVAIDLATGDLHAFYVDENFTLYQRTLSGAIWGVEEAIAGADVTPDSYAYPPDVVKGATEWEFPASGWAVLGSGEDLTSYFAHFYTSDVITWLGPVYLPLGPAIEGDFDLNPKLELYFEGSPVDWGHLNLFPETTSASQFYRKLEVYNNSGEYVGNVLVHLETLIGSFKAAVGVNGDTAEDAGAYDYSENVYIPGIADGTYATIWVLWQAPVPQVIGANEYYIQFGEF